MTMTLPLVQESLAVDKDESNFNPQWLTQKPHHMYFEEKKVTVMLYQQ